MTVAQPYSSCLTVADDRPGSQGIVRILQEMRRNLPKWCSPVVERSAKDILQFDGFEDTHLLGIKNRSIIMVETARNDKAGRKWTLNALHNSELAFWGEHANEVLLGCRQAVSESAGTIIINESTANGWGGVFYDECERSRGGKGGYRFIFIPWFAIDEYRCKPGDSKLVEISGGIIDPLELQALIDAEEWEKAGLDDNELELLINCKGDRFGPIDAEQILWRRWAIEGKAAGDLDRFKQEYPATPEEAFIVSGSPAFSPGALLWQKENNCREGEAGELVRNEESKRLDWHPTRGGRVTMYEPVTQGHKYLVAIDYAEGSEAHVDQTRDHDNTAFFIFNRTTKTQVAKAVGRFVPDEAAEIAINLGEYYNYATLVPENNGGWATATIDAAREVGYPSIYMTEIENVAGKDFTLKYGWITTHENRPGAFSRARAVVRRKEVTIRSESLVSELLSIVYKRLRTGRVKEEAKSGCHDDEAMAFVIAMRVDEKLGAIIDFNERKKMTLNPSSPLYDVWLAVEESERFVFEETL